MVDTNVGGNKYNFCGTFYFANIVISLEMKNNYRIEKIDHLTYTEEDWKRYYDFRIKSCALKGIPMPFDSLEALKDRNLQSIKEGQEIYKVWKNEQENGTFIFSLDFKDDLEKRSTYLNNDMNDKYLESNLLEMILQKFIDYDETSNSLSMQSKEGMNDYIEDYFGAYVGSIVEFYELNVKEANVEKIDAWLAEAPAKFPNLRIAFYKEIPDDLLEEYAAFFTQMNKDMPANSDFDPTVTAASIKSRQEAGKLKHYCAYSYLIFNEANQLIAKTNVFGNLKQPKKMHQYMTGVMENYRGRGLSKWLKAAMFNKLTADFPELEKIETEAHPENHASRELSKQMGYKRMGSYKEFLIDRANIIKHLDSIG